MKRALSIVLAMSVFTSIYGVECHADAAAVETETEVIEQDSEGLAPKEVTGESGWESQYPTLEQQVEQQLATLSDMDAEQVEKLYTSYKKEINYSIQEVADSMRDSSTLSVYDDSTMATVKLLHNWMSVMEDCGEFQNIEEYTADLTNNVITLDILTKYEQAEEEGITVYVKFIYDLNNNVTLMDWKLSSGMFDDDERKGSDNPAETDLWAYVYALEERIAALEATRQKVGEVRIVG